MVFLRSMVIEQSAAVGEMNNLHFDLSMVHEGAETVGLDAALFVDRGVIGLKQKIQ